MPSVTVKAPINIALIKYWGKKNTEHVIPFNDSISLTVSSLYTQTTIQTNRREAFQYELNGVLLKDRALSKVKAHLKHFTKSSLTGIKIISINTVPTAAGLASSASSFAALSLAANTFFNTQFSLEKLISISRLGSGSSCRSFHGGFVHWQKNGKVTKISDKTDHLSMIIVLVDTHKKPISSTQAMAHTVKTSPLYETWVKQAHIDTIAMKKAIKNQDFSQIGAITERNFLSMHATMLASNPPILYMRESSLNVLAIVHDLRQSGLQVYATMDAGVNVKLLCKKGDVSTVIKKLKTHHYTDLIISDIATEGAVIINET